MHRCSYMTYDCYLPSQSHASGRLSHSLLRCRHRLSDSGALRNTACHIQCVGTVDCSNDTLPALSVCAACYISGWAYRGGKRELDILTDIKK
jgi:hypothetical protein